jgi:hypothetical protein
VGKRRPRNDPRVDPILAQLKIIERKLGNVETGTKLLIWFNEFQQRQLVKQATRLLEVIAILEDGGVSRARFNAYISEARAIVARRTRKDAIRTRARR